MRSPIQARTRFNDKSYVTDSLSVSHETENGEDHEPGQNTGTAVCHGEYDGIPAGNVGGYLLIIIKANINK